jgi:hypothetical protein
MTNYPHAPYVSNGRALLTKNVTKKKEARQALLQRIREQRRIVMRNQMKQHSY